MLLWHGATEENVSHNSRQPLMVLLHCDWCRGALRKGQDAPCLQLLAQIGFGGKRQNIYCLCSKKINPAGTRRRLRATVGSIGFERYTWPKIILNVLHEYTSS